MLTAHGLPIFGFHPDSSVNIRQGLSVVFYPNSIPSPLAPKIVPLILEGPYAGILRMISQCFESMNPISYAIKRRFSGGFNFKIFVFQSFSGMHLVGF